MTLSLAAALSLCAPVALAQTHLGELLDSGAKPLSVEEFKREVVQRTIVGPMPSGGTIEVMYAPNGSIAGTGTPLLGSGLLAGSSYAPVLGEWRIDDNGRICTTLRVGLNTMATPALTLPPRCQVWFKYGDDYFIADSDSDRQVRVYRRTLKP